MVLASTSCSLSDLANIATVTGAAIAVCALIYTAYQVRQSTKISRGQFWLKLEKLFNIHDEIHYKLRPGGDWHKDGNGPKTLEEWAKVEDYMGLFEHCETMIENKLIDLETFKDLFGYRVLNLLGNTIIVKAKLIEEKEYWKRFNKLLLRLNISIAV